MTVRAVFDIRKPDDVEMRLIAVMPLKDWKRVRDVLNDPSDPAAEDYWHPASELVRMIGDMVDRADTTFSAQSDDPKVQS